jgi:predicted esterase
LANDSLWGSVLASAKKQAVNRGEEKMPTHLRRFLGLTLLAAYFPPMLASPEALAADAPPITGKYQNGELIPLEVAGRRAFLIRPTKKVDAGKGWVWTAPFWLAVNHENREPEHRFYVERFLDAGLHVAGVDVGTSCGSPREADLFQKMYERLTTQYDLNRKTRLLGQSNGGLIVYAWAFRHPDSVGRIAGIYPATDFRSWPGLANVIKYPDPDLGYGLTLEELEKRLVEFNPIDNVSPLVRCGVRIFHLHGDKDELVPMGVNSSLLVERYKALGGDARLEVLPGLGHGNKAFYESESLARFLTE